MLEVNTTEVVSRFTVSQFVCLFLLMFEQDKNTWACSSSSLVPSIVYPLNTHVYYMSNSAVSINVGVEVRLLYHFLSHNSVVSS